MVRHNSRQAQAFQALLTPSDDEGPPPKNRRRSSTRRSTERVPGFRLRDSDDGQQLEAASTTQQNGDLQQLYDMFAPGLDCEIIQDVYTSCGASLEQSLDVLLSLTATNTTPLEAPQSNPTSSFLTPDETPSLWDMLPTECKESILTLLTAKDLARLAPTSKEFATYVATARRNVTYLTIPPGISTRAVRGVVQAHIAATTMDCTQWLGAVSMGGKNVDEVSEKWDDALHAISIGEYNRSSGVLIRKLVVRWRAKDTAPPDTFVHSISDHLRHLTSIELSDFGHGLGDETLVALSLYKQDAAVSLGLEEEFQQQLTVSNGHGESQDGLVATKTGALETPAEAVARIAAAAKQQQQQQSYSSPTRSSSNIELPTSSNTATSNSNNTGGMQELVVKGANVSTNGIRNILRGASCMKSLVSLDISRCSSVTGDALNPGPRSIVQAIKATACSGIRNVSIQVPSTSQLTVLSLPDCRNLTEAVVSAPKLVELNVSGCKKLEAISLRCPKLKKLSAAKCGALELVLPGSSFECPVIEELNLDGCRSIDQDLETLAPTLTNLKSLSLSGCSLLSRLTLSTCTVLERVAVDGCGVLQRIVLSNAPRIHSLTAKGCVQLTELKLLDVSKILVLDLENCSRIAEVRFAEEADGGAHLKASSASSNKFEGVKRRLNLKGCPVSNATKLMLQRIVLQAN